MTKYYANNRLRRQLSKEEKKRYNAYKKRECERRRRYKRKGFLQHKCFHTFRCESCKIFYEEEAEIRLTLGYSVCKKCINEWRPLETFFKKIKFDWTQYKQILGDVKNSIQIQVELKGNECKQQDLTKEKTSVCNPFEGWPEPDGGWENWMKKLQVLEDQHYHWLKDQTWEEQYGVNAHFWPTYCVNVDE